MTVERAVAVHPAGLSFRGGALQLWKSKAHEVILAGAAETGKTFAALHKLNLLLEKYPGAQGLMVRKTYKSLCGSALQTYARKVLAKGAGVLPYGGEAPKWFDYPNGSRLNLGGMDNPDKILSAEYDFVYVNQAEELDVGDWEVLLSRATGRAGNAPWSQVFGDCNPGAPTHWIKHRPSLALLDSRHEDNPALYDDAGQVTLQGLRTLAVLDALTGLRHARLRLGKWVQAEGVVYEGWDPRLHLIDRRPIPADWPRLWTVDFGFTHPFVWQAWAKDGDGRLYRYREVYHTQRLVEDHAKRIRQLTMGEPLPEVILCDHDAEDRATLEKHLGLSTTPAVKVAAGLRLPGIQEVAERLRPAGDGKPRLYLLRDSLDEADPRLTERRQPTCTEEEFETYVWDERQTRRDVPVKESDHGLDALRYLTFYLDGLNPGWGFGAAPERESLFHRMPKGMCASDVQRQEDDEDGEVKPWWERG